jgi:diguanylate cyclase (GGDEF)-like protein
VGLTKKIITLIILLFINFVAIFYLGVHVFFLKSFEEIEKQNMEKNIKRLERALNNEIEDLEGINIEYSQWDDTYEFIVNKNMEYVESNFTEMSTFERFRLEFMIFADNNGSVVLANGYDMKNDEEILLNKDLLNHILSKKELVFHPDEKSSTSGIVMLPEGPALIVSRPILTTTAEGPVRGSLILGRFFGDEEVRWLSNTTNLNIRMSSADDNQRDFNFEKILSQFPKNSNIYITPENQDYISGYTLVNDIYGDPAIILKVSKKRDILKQGRASVNYFIIMFVFGGILLCFILMLALKKIVLERLIELSSKANNIGLTKDMSIRMSVKGKDELSFLTVSINRMLDVLEEAQNKLRQMAYHDPLTNLPNRSQFFERLSREMERRKNNEGSDFAVLFLDLDNFKMINDEIGHHMGDKFLKKIAEKLKKIIDDKDMVARFGGDEFIIIQTEIKGIEEVERLARRIIQELDYTLRHDGKEIKIGVSIGIAIYRGREDDGDSLIKKADIAMYRCKKRDDIKYEFYDKNDIN